MHNNPNSPSAATVSEVLVPPPGSVRIGPFISIPKVLQQLGHDPRPVLRRVGLSLKSMSNPDMIVPFAKIGRLLSACAEVSGCPYFGLFVGQQVPTSTLGRQLRSAGTAFRYEVDAMRFAQAKHLLADATLNAKQVAFTLSYADVSAFTHAFKRWSGMSPGQWRKSKDRYPA